MIIGSTSVYVYPSSALIDRREARRGGRAPPFCGVLLPNPAFSSSTLPYLLLCSSIPSFISLILSYLSSTVPSFRPSSSQSSTRAARSGWLVRGCWLARFACPASWARPRSLATDAVFRLDQELEIIGTCGIQSGQSQQRRLTITPLTSRFAPKMGRCCILAKLLPMIKVDERFISFDGRSPSAAGGRVRWVRFRYDW
jgi:hypothetical protein